MRIRGKNIQKNKRKRVSHKKNKIRKREGIEKGNDKEKE